MARQCSRESLRGSMRGNGTGQREEFKINYQLTEHRDQCRVQGRNLSAVSSAFWVRDTDVSTINSLNIDSNVECRVEFSARLAVPSVSEIQMYYLARQCLGRDLACVGVR